MAVKRSKSRVRPWDKPMWTEKIIREVLPQGIKLKMTDIIKQSTIKAQMKAKLGGHAFYKRLFTKSLTQTFDAMLAAGEIQKTENNLFWRKLSQEDYKRLELLLVAREIVDEVSNNCKVDAPGGKDGSEEEKDNIDN